MPWSEIPLIVGILITGSAVLAVLLYRMAGRSEEIAEHCYRPGPIDTGRESETGPPEICSVCAVADDEDE